MTYRHLLFFAGTCALLLPGLRGQVVQMGDPNATLCAGVFIDDGDEGDPNGGPYSNTDYTITICPDTPGDAISVTFTSFDLQTNPNPNNSDVLIIYDGNSVAAPEIGAASGNTFLGTTAVASINNASGCLTFRFLVNNNASGGDAGWVAEIECVTPCTYPQSGVELISPEPFEGLSSVGVCPNEPITFDGSSSEPDASPLATWIWNWGDGSVEEFTSPVAQHAYSVPGEYLVTLVVEDENGCGSINLEPYQVLVSTLPVFNTNFTSPLCAGSPGWLNGDPFQSVTWTALPPQSVSEDQNLPDNSNVPFDSEMPIDFFDADQVVTECDDILSITANLEHTFIGDLTIWLECPNGQQMLLLDNGPSGGPDATGCMYPDLGGNDLGEPFSTPPVGYDYTWTPDADFIMDDPSNPAVGGGTVPGGTYLPCEDFCSLLGCPLNGIWTLYIHDQWLGDDGFLFNWNLEFNPLIVPGVTTFTPTIGLEADSSFWNLNLNDVGVETIDASADYVTLEFDTPGQYSFDYVLVNNFGCEWDTTVVINVVPGLGTSITAGPDVVFCGDPVQLQGSFADGVVSGCGGVEGTFEMCYGDNDYQEHVFCPDTPGDGTVITLSFDQGQVENAIFDQFYVYDGGSTASPVLAGPLSGDLTGLVYTATNPSGCLTISIDSDGSVSCEAGFYDPILICTTCGGPSTCGYTWTWSPTEYLDNPNVPNPTVLQFDGIPTTYTLLVEPLGMENCGTDDQVQVLPGFAFTYDVDQPSCFLNDGVISVDIDELPSEGPWTVVLSEGGTVVSNEVSNGGMTSIDGLDPGAYLLEVSDTEGCSYDFTIDLVAPPAMTIVMPPAPTICIDGSATLSVSSTMDPAGTWTYAWNNGVGSGSTITVSPVTTTTYQVIAEDPMGCPSAPYSITVTVYDSLEVDLEGDSLICGGSFTELEAIGTDGGSGSGYTYDWTWEGSSLATVPLENWIDYPPATGTYCVTLSDNCTTPPVTACLEVVIETPIPATFTSDTTKSCVPGSIAFLLDADETLLSSALWGFGDGTTSTDWDPVHTYTAPGWYDVALAITSNLGCTYLHSEPEYIEIFTPPFVGFTAFPQPAQAPDTRVSFEAVQSPNVVSWEWIFNVGDPIGSATTPTTVFTFPIDQGGNYPVMLTVTDENGCESSVIRNVQILDMFNLFIPTSFSPNNDGVNDAFQVYGTDIDPDRFTLRVFNRWGGKVFESFDPVQPWHGPATDDSDHYAPNGTYYYHVIMYNLSSPGQRREFTGFVTVIR
jgi:gliding motility-associated-like protein